MFIDPTMNPRLRSGGAAMFPAMISERPTYISLLWSEEESFGSRVF
jgi:hypothetical protein